MGFCHNYRNNQQPTKTTIKTFYTLQTTKPIKKFWRYLLGFEETQKKKFGKKKKKKPSVRRNQKKKKKKKGKNGALVAGMGATSGSPESQSQMDRRYGLCWQ
jgi:hypothetical protein